MVHMPGLATSPFPEARLEQMQKRMEIELENEFGQPRAYNAFCFAGHWIVASDHVSWLFGQCGWFSKTERPKQR